MSSIQVLAFARPASALGRGRVLLRTAACGLALVLGSGCAWFPREPAPVARTPPASTPVADHAELAPQPTAIEAALARGGSTHGPRAAEPSTVTAATAPVALNPNAPKQYTVKRGDTLWGIAAMFLKDPWLWPEIWDANPAIGNPHLIYPGDVLTLAYGADGRPRIHLERGSESVAVTHVDPIMRSTALESAIPTLPYGAIASFLGRPALITRDQARRAPYVIAPRDRHVAVGAPSEVYVVGLKGAAPGRYSVMRLGEPMRDPQTHKFLGYMGIFTGTARVDSTGKITKVALVDSARETVEGDLLFPEEPMVSRDLQPHPAPPRLDGQIMSVVDGVTMIGQYQVVAINRGARQGLQPGHVLAVDETGEVVQDKSCSRRAESFCVGGGPQVQVHLPRERTGTLLVFKTYDEVSFGLTVSVEAPVRVADHVRTP
jgi:LysM repeat protein